MHGPFPNGAPVNVSGSHPSTLVGCCPSPQSICSLFGLNACGIDGFVPVSKFFQKPVVKIAVLADSEMDAVSAGFRTPLRDPKSEFSGYMGAGISSRE